MDSELELVSAVVVREMDSVLGSASVLGLVLG